jgi:transcriptional regulator with XRE-family HTH domain
VTDRQVAWRKRQRAVLTAARKASKRNRTEIAERAGLEYWQVVRLETGKARLPADLIPALARGYGTTPEQLIADLEIVSAQPYNPRKAMEDSGVVSPHRIDQVEADVAGKPEPAQRARVEGEIALGADPDAPQAESDPDRRRRTG